MEAYAISSGTAAFSSFSGEFFAAMQSNYLQDWINGFPGVIWEMNPETQCFSFVSRQVESLLGYPVEDWQNFDFWVRTVHPADRAFAVDFFSTSVARKKNHEFVYRVISLDGSVKWLHQKVQLALNERGNVERIYGFLIDVTERMIAEKERRELERKSMEGQKLESLGLLAGGVAHDFNNLLMGILGNAELARDIISEDSEAAACLESIETAARRAAELTRQMLVYSGRGTMAMRDFNFNDIVEEMIRLLKASLPKHIEFNLSLTPDPPEVFGDPTQMRQVIMNLMTNAADAIHGRSGVISIHTGVVKLDEQTIKAFFDINSEAKAGSYAYCEIMDNGTGMPPEIMARIFDPFFTTKEKGHGLGLAAICGIIRSHKGLIDVQSTQGKGTTISVMLPLRESHEVKQPEVARKPPVLAQGGDYRVLIIDDEALVRQVAQRVLEHNGFKCETAESGYKGIEMVRKDPDRYDVVLLDMTMPGLNGEETWHFLKVIKPGIRVLLNSGYSSKQIQERMLAEGMAGFIEKPYRSAELVEAILEVIHR